MQALDTAWRALCDAETALLGAIQAFQEARSDVWHHMTCRIIDSRGLLAKVRDQRAGVRK